MADIDKLRGAPSGHTAKSSNSSKTLKEAATIAATVVMATTPMATQAQNTGRDWKNKKNRKKEKVILVSLFKNCKGVCVDEKSWCYFWWCYM